MDFLTSVIKVTRFFGLSAYSVENGRLKSSVFFIVLTLCTLAAEIGLLYKSVAFYSLRHLHEVAGFTFTVFFCIFIFSASAVACPTMLLLRHSSIRDGVNSLFDFQPELIKRLRSTPTALRKHTVPIIHILVGIHFFSSIHVRGYGMAVINSLTFLRCYLNMELFIVYVNLVRAVYEDLNLFLTNDAKRDPTARMFRTLMIYEEAVKDFYEVLNQAFGLGSMFFYWCTIVSFTYIEIKVFYYGIWSFITFDGVLRVFYYVVGPITFVSASALLTREAEKTATLIHDIFIENDDPAVREEVEIFSLQLLHRKIEFTACGFFKLDFSLLYSMVGVVTTYVVILIQFQSPDKCSNNGTVAGVTPDH